MKRTTILLTLLLAAALVGCGGGGDKATATPAAPTPTLAPVQGPALPPTSVPVTLAPAEVQQRFEREDVILLDVREPDEWSDDGYINGAVNIPLDQLPSRVDELDRDKTIIVMCRNGNRSTQGLSILEAAGFADLHELGGGINAWKSAGLSVSYGLPPE
jgi:rhodanese-related sulfurtransferase